MIKIRYKKIIFYATLISCALFIKIIPGLYLFDIIMFLYLLYLISEKKLKLNKKGRNIINAILIILIFPTVISILIKSIIEDGDLFGSNGINNFYYLWNYFLLCVYITVFSSFEYIIKKINLNLVLLFISFPLLISIICFVSPEIRNYVSIIYNINSFGVFGRYGGLYGEAVAGYSMLAFTVIFCSFYLKKLTLINEFIFLLSCSLGLISIILSGIRTGIIVLFLLFIYILLTTGKSIFPRRILIYAFVSIASIFIYLFNFKKDIYLYVIDRFSLYKLFVDLGFLHTNDYGSNMVMLTNSFERIIIAMEENFHHFFFGSNFLRHDVFYIDLLAKHGILSIICVLFFITYCLVLIKKNNFTSSKMLSVWVVFVSLIISMKANYIFHNYFLFIICLIYTRLRSTYLVKKPMLIK